MPPSIAKKNPESREQKSRIRPPGRSATRVHCPNDAGVRYRDKPTIPQRMTNRLLKLTLPRPALRTLVDFCRGRFTTSLEPISKPIPELPCQERPPPLTVSGPFHVLSSRIVRYQTLS